MLQNGNGGIDWAGFGLAVEYFGVENVDVLIGLLLTLKAHKKPKDED